MCPGFKQLGASLRDSTNILQEGDRSQDSRRITPSLRRGGACCRNWHVVQRMQAGIDSYLPICHCGWDTGFGKYWAAQTSTTGLASFPGPIRAHIVPGTEYVTRATQVRSITEHTTSTPSRLQCSDYAGHGHFGVLRSPYGEIVCGTFLQHLERCWRTGTDKVHTLSVRHPSTDTSHSCTPPQIIRCQMLQLIQIPSEAEFGLLGPCSAVVVGPRPVLPFVS